jgi:hypothetical protein
MMTMIESILSSGADYYVMALDDVDDETLDWPILKKRCDVTQHSKERLSLMHHKK